jgi:phosphocarrier protein HPr
MPKILLTINHPVGLHARPASIFVQTAGRYKSSVVVTCGERTADAKSIISVLGLGANQGASIEITAEGEDAREVLNALRLIVESDFSVKV